MSSSLQTKTIGALMWSSVQEFSQRGLHLVIGLLLARMLGPEEFGLVAMLTVFIAVAQALVNSGFGAALVQRKTVTLTDECSVFYFNVLMGVLMTLALYAAAPSIAAFYNQPQLSDVTRAFALVLVVDSLIVVQAARMTRHLDFRRQALINVVSTSVSGVIGVVMAWKGYGVWSLVAQQITSSVMRVVMYWVVSPWRPTGDFSLASLRSMFAFGSGMMGSSLLNSLFGNLYSLVIGKIYSASVLGYFNRAAKLQGVVAHGLADAVNRVVFPVFSRLQGDQVRMKSALQRGIKLMAFVQFPLMLGLAAVAEPLILLLLTEKWAPAIPLLQVLCISGMLYPLHLLNLNVLMAVGRSGLFFRLQVIKKVLTVINILVTARWGVQAMVWGIVVNGVLFYFLNAYYTKQFAGYSALEQVRDVLPYVGTATAMALAVAFTNLPLAAGLILQVGFKVALGMVFYLVLCRGFRLGALAELVDVVHSKVPLPGWAFGLAGSRGVARAWPGAAARKPSARTTGRPQA